MTRVGAGEGRATEVIMKKRLVAGVLLSTAVLIAIWNEVSAIAQDGGAPGHPLANRAVKTPDRPGQDAGKFGVLCLLGFFLGFL